MRGLIFEYDVARLALAKAGGVVTRKAFSASRAPVRLAEIPEPEPPGPGWVVCETRWSGICGSDVKQILLKGSRDNPLTALLSFPHVLGHEAVATRSDTGQRVALNPWLTCGLRVTALSDPGGDPGQRRGPCRSRQRLAARDPEATADRRPARADLRLRHAGHCGDRPTSNKGARPPHGSAGSRHRAVDGIGERASDAPVRKRPDPLASRTVPLHRVVAERADHRHGGTEFRLARLAIRWEIGTLGHQRSGSGESNGNDRDHPNRLLLHSCPLFL
jgi:hypothetical protein